jgi:predicted nucleotidyltransferase
MIVQVFNKDILKILTVFSISRGSKFLRNELKDKTRLHNVNLDNAINTLINCRLIKKEKRFLSLDFENQSIKSIIDLVFREYKRLKELPLDVYFVLIEFIESLSKIKNIKVYLFGSYAKLIFKENSDIDLAVIGEINRKEFDGIIQRLESKYDRVLEVHYFTNKFYKNKKDPLVKEILRNGVELI